MSAERTVRIEGRRLRVSSLDKVLYPATGTTKADVLGYLTEVAPVMIPHVAGRPATRKRWPDGVGTEDEPGQFFFAKAIESSAPDWVVRGDIEHSAGPKTYPLVEDAATLAWLGQVAALEVHVPQWRLGTDGRPRNPDRMVLDLDPGPGAGLPECAEVARLIRPLLQGMGLETVPVTSGSKGIHLYAALDGRHDSDHIRDVAHELARSLEADHPDLIVSDMKKSLRRGKVLIDWSQNSASKTTIAPYSLRGRLRPTVAVPRTWEELDDPGLRHLEHGEVLELLAGRSDPMTAVAPPDLLEVYRAKREAGRTPEPVPERLASTGPAEAPGHTFVIQEHHASRLHWDLRLEHRGTLASWALPKGVPTGRKNHLAVRTEDHPLEYLTFSGTIPEGEYGAGEMHIWDSGTYERHKWHEGQEVLITLTGQEDGGLATDGPGRETTLALIHTGSGDEEKNWLAHLMEGGGRRGATRRSRSTPARQGGRRSRPEAPRPMLATRGSARDLHAEDDWALELKWDGVRAVVLVDGEDVRLVSRTGQEMTAQYPELSGITASLHPDAAVLDGEIVALDERGRPSFALLQQRIQADKDVGRLAEEIPVRLVLFDVLDLDGEATTGKVYDRRRELLREAVDPAAHDHVDVPEAVEGSLEEALELSRRRGLEGVVAKRRNSRYAVGRRSRAWIKITHSRTQEAVVIGWRPGKGEREGAVGSLLLAVPDGAGALVYAGRVGTGFRHEEAVRWRSELGRKERRTPPVEGVPREVAREAHWVTPERVGEVELASWTEDGRMRHPRWRGWRPDKTVEELEAPEDLP